jgi:hypothetical protein
VGNPASGAWKKKMKQENAILLSHLADGDSAGTLMCPKCKTEKTPKQWLKYPHCLCLGGQDGAPAHSSGANPEQKPYTHLPPSQVGQEGGCVYQQAHSRILDRLWLRLCSLPALARKKIR